jgi:isopenicillin N synthase-like dioxygenase
MSVTIPVLDCRQIESCDFSHRLGTAFSEIGFVALEHHGVAPDLRARALKVVEAFFALPQATKAKYTIAGGAGARGFTPFGIEVAKDQSIPDLKEFWHVGREMSPGTSSLPRNVWPTEIADFRGTLFELYRQLEQLGLGVLRAVARELSLEEQFFSDKVDCGNSILRALHYPPIAGNVGGAVRAAAHEDINLITLLIGSPQPGLEVLSQSGQWVKAPAGDDLILCNVGDMLQRLTNHVLSSTTHRVVNPPSPWCDVSRYSLPFFLHPNPDFLIETLDGCVSEMRPNRYPAAITADDYLKERLREIGLLV